MEKEIEKAELEEKEEEVKPDIPEGIEDEAPVEAEETPAAEPEAEEPEPVEGGLEEKPEPAEKTFTQEQVNKLVGNARMEGRKKGYEDARSEIYSKYGVDSDDQLDGIFVNGSRYEELNRRYADSGKSLREVQTELALVKSGVLPERQADVKAILSANGLDITVENIESMLPTHPEWKANATQGAPVAPAPSNPIAQPKPSADSQLPAHKAGLGVEPSSIMDEGNNEKAEYEKAMELFGLRKK